MTHASHPNHHVPTPRRRAPGGPLSLLLLGLALALGWAAPASAQAAAPQDGAQASPWAERGRLVSWQHRRTLSRQQVRRAQYDLPFTDSYAGFGLEDFTDFYTRDAIRAVVRHRIDVYQVIYETIDPHGRPTLASGAALVPRLGPTDAPPALWGLMRGTIFYDADAPSHGDMPDWGIWRGLLPAAAGYVVAMPDYLGFGASRHLPHTYLQPEPTATAAIDLLRATRHLAAELELPLRDEVFVTGHSQGGHGALATQRMLEAEHADEFDLTAVSAASAPYALSGLMANLLRSDVLIAQQVTSLYFVALNAVHDLGPLSDIFAAPYDRLVLEVHDKQRTNAAVIAGLPTGDSAQLYTDGFRALFADDAISPVEALLARADMHVGWTPQAPLRLFHGSEDDVVPAVLSQVVAGALTQAGGDVQLEVFEGAGHLQAIVPANLEAIRWFDALLAEGE